ncbi:MAG TPA: copper chaperone PCu(A)C [Mycobacteriales bacterium]|nr:copper chaperone PCu(A)C [Mycobacteriales bacterium]
MSEPAGPAAPARRRRFGGLIALLAVAALAGAALVHHGSSPSTRAGTASGRIGPLRVTDAYIPAQTSATVAAVYLTIRNTSASVETLQRVTSDRAPSAQVMKEVTDVSRGASSMTEEPGLSIPGGATVRLTPGVEHLMLVDPPTRLTQGEVVTVTLQFAPAGTLTLRVPVTAVGGP